MVGTKDLLAFGQPVEKGRRLNPWLKKQHMRLLALKDTLLDSMTGVARDNLRSGNDAHEVSAHGLHQADAGSDAYDRDFALNLLSQEQDALFEIDEALKRIQRGAYGTCEMSGKPIPKARLEARPFARFTVECQSEIEKKNRFSRIRQPVTRLFEPLEDESGDESDEESAADAKE
jgi:RNA polymerase-binding protein DksA